MGSTRTIIKASATHTHTHTHREREREREREKNVQLSMVHCAVQFLPVETISSIISVCVGCFNHELKALE